MTPVEPSIHVEPGACECHDLEVSCNRVILESRKGAFKIRILSSDESGHDDNRALASWDLATFRWPRPTAKLSKTVLRDKIGTLELVFTNESGMRLGYL